MPYKNNTALPEGVRDNLPKHAQDIYRETFNSAVSMYEDESQAHKVAWGSVKNKYEKGEDGKWHVKGGD